MHIFLGAAIIFSSVVQELKSQFGKALKTIESTANYTIESANSLFVQVIDIIVIHSLK